MSETVVVRRDAGVATITLNRPEALNACSLELKHALLAAVHDVAGDDDVRAVVLTGAGRAFCVGQDLREHHAVLAAGDPEPMRTVVEHYNPIVRTIVEMPKPVIAAVNGIAAGAGASFAFAADLRVAAESASFELAFGKVGLSLDSGASWLLPRLVGHARATAMCLLGEAVDSERALDMGLVNAVVADSALAAASTAVAARLAAGPTAAYAAIKNSLQYSSTAPLPDALGHEATLQAQAAGTADHRAAVEAFLAKTAPTFTGR
jgi:2-(1,2-epoxy-1,2-dihydrophenyl)acetyl-CoA isomerase